MDNDDQYAQLVKLAEESFLEWKSRLPDALQVSVVSSYDVWDSVFLGGDEIYAQDIPDIVREMTDVRSKERDQLNVRIEQLLVKVEGKLGAETASVEDLQHVAETLKIVSGIIGHKD